MSLVNSCVFLIGGEKCFLFDQLIGNYHETCVQYNIQHSNFKLRYKKFADEMLRTKFLIKFIFLKKATEIDEIFTFDLTLTT